MPAASQKALAAGRLRSPSPSTPSMSASRAKHACSIAERAAALSSGGWPGSGLGVSRPGGATPELPASIG